ncbi:hypothetical protein RSAG8_10865, partial [Rhizoctonia solani AG-8 WAC10335]
MISLPFQFDASATISSHSFQKIDPLCGCLTDGNFNSLLQTVALPSGSTWSLSASTLGCNWR